MAHIDLIEGPVGAGKSTYAGKLASERRAVHIALDAWFANLYSPDRPDSNIWPWYSERKERCLRTIWTPVEGMMAADTNVILELGLIQRHARQAFYQLVDAKGYSMSVHVLDAPRELRRERVHIRNREQGPTFSMIVPDHVFDMASDLWEAPDEAECAARSIEFIEQAAAD